MSETLVGINGFGRIGRIVFRNAYVPPAIRHLNHQPATFKARSNIRAALSMVP